MNVQANHDALSRIARLQRAHQIMHDDIMAAAARSEKVLDGLERDLAAMRDDTSTIPASEPERGCRLASRTLTAGTSSPPPFDKDLAAFRADSDARLTDADRRAIAVAERAEAERARVAGAKFGPPPTCPSCGKPNDRPFHTCRRGSRDPYPFSESEGPMEEDDNA